MKQVFRWLKALLGLRPIPILQRLKRPPLHLDLWLHGGGMALLAAGAVSLAALKVSELFGEEGKAGTWGEIQVRRVYLNRGDYLEYIPTLTRLNPGVRFSLNQEGNAVVLSIADEQLFPDLMMSLSTLQSFKPRVAWDLEELCAKKCSDEAVARAVVKGFTQEIR